MMNYEPYDDIDFYLIMNEPREVSDQPYKLHAAFIISCIFESLDEDDEDWNRHKMWGRRIPITILQSIIKNANEQFVFAANNGTQIDIWDKPFSIRKSNAFDRKRLGDICKFEVYGDECILSRNGIMNLAGNSKLAAHHKDKLEYEDNKSYLRKVIMTAEDDDNNGWDKLTDMEVTMYLWAIFYRKCEFENAIQFREEYKQDIYTTEADDKSCWTDIANINGKPHGLYTFSASKVRNWNSEHNQTSIIDSVDTESANVYWYDVAIKTTCK